VPIPRKVVWGSSDFFKNFGINEPNIGELWMIGSKNEIRGTHSVTLEEFSVKFPKFIYGNKKPFPRFPVLIKFISTLKWLSVQLHPDDRFAIQVESEPWGKVEMWYFMSVKKGSQIICGLKNLMTEEEFTNLVNNFSLNKVLNYLDIAKDDWILIKPGIVHAIGPGISLLEIQMNSDLTYRIYDWKRCGLNGKPRELHVDKALKVIDFPANLKIINESGKVEFEFPTFVIETVELLEAGEIELDTRNETFHIIIPVNNDLTTDEEMIRRFESVLITADEGKYKIKGNKGSKLFLIKLKGG